MQAKPMIKYRARPCPNCNYYLGFSVVKPPLKTTEVAVTSFCLNCSYKLPMHAVVRGIRKATSTLRRGSLRLANIGRGARTIEAAQSQSVNQPAPIRPSDYARHLRAIGQDLENLRLTTFNLECAGNSYLVWARHSGTEFDGTSLSLLKKTRLLKLWKNRTPPRSQGREEYFKFSTSHPTKRYRYSLRELERMEQAAQDRRRENSGIADGHSLSQLLRTVGGLVGQRGERLLGISWQELSVSIVVGSTQGQIEIDVFRPDNLYDLWVRMYLRRDNRVLSDIPS